MAYNLIRPIRDNKEAFYRLYPDAWYAGDIGDPNHENGPSEHNAWWHEDSRNTPGFVYVQDLGQKGNSSFNLPGFARWLIDQCRAGRYPEVKYLITRHPANAGTGYYGLFDVRYNWRQQGSSGHESHIHISYGPYTNNTPSTIVNDWYNTQHNIEPAPPEDNPGDEEMAYDIPLDGIKSWTITPVEAGTADPRPAWVNVCNDTLGQKYGLRIWASKGDGAWFPVRATASLSGKETDGDGIIVLGNGEVLSGQLPKGTRSVSIKRVPAVKDGPIFDGNLTWHLERGQLIR